MKTSRRPVGAALRVVVCPSFLPPLLRRCLIRLRSRRRGAGTARGRSAIPAAWVNGVVPVSSPSTQLFFPNDMSGSYRAFNDLGVLTVGAINVATRTPTATFVGQNAGSAFQFADGAAQQPRQRPVPLRRCDGRDKRHALQGNLTFGGTGYGQVWFASPCRMPLASVGRLTIDAPAANDRDSFLRLEGANTFSGGVDLKRGVLELGNATAAGTGVITANGGVLRTSAAVTVGNGIVTNQR